MICVPRIRTTVSARIFQPVKSLAKHAAHLRLADKRIGVNLANDAEDLTAVVLPGDGGDDLILLARITSLGTEVGDATMQFVDKCIGNLLVLLGEDEELHRLAHAVHDPIDSGRADERVAQAEEDLLQTAYLGKEVTARDSHYIAHEQDASHRQVLELVDNHSHNVRTAGRAVVEEDDAQGCAVEDTSEHHRHERIGDDRHVQDGNDLQPKREPEHAIERTEHVAFANGEERRNEQQNIDGSRRRPDRNDAVRGEVDDLAETRQTTAYDSVRHQDMVHHKGVRDGAQGDHQILLEEHHGFGGIQLFQS